MKIGLTEINDILRDAKSIGHDLRMSDIFYTFALTGFKDKKIVYTVFFGKGASEKDIEEYDSCKKITFLKRYMKANFFNDDIKVRQISKKNKQYEDISFEENKEALVKMLAEIREMSERGELEKKDAVKLETDIRTKLNDKFSVSEKQDEQRVVVLAKYNHICEWTHKECFLQTKEYAMKHWGLVEKNNNIKDNSDE